MRTFVRRLVLGLGLMLIVVGWGVTRYADARQEAIASGESASLQLWLGEPTKVKSWLGGDSFVPNRTLYTGGVIGMAAGACVIVLAFPRGSWQPSIGP